MLAAKLGCCFGFVIWLGIVVRFGPWLQMLVGSFSGLVCKESANKFIQSLGVAFKFCVGRWFVIAALLALLKKGSWF